MTSSASGDTPPDLEVILAAHGEAETAGFFENFRVGQRTLAHSAQVMHLPAPLRWLICTLGALRKRFGRAKGSPHNAWTRAQAAALEDKLAQRLGQTVTVRAAFASAEPSVERLLKQPPAAGRRIVVSMSPSDSRLSCGLLCHALQLGEPTGRSTLVIARLWADPAFVALNAAHVRSACRNEQVKAESSGKGQTALMLVLHGTLVKDQHGKAPQFHAGEAEKTQFAEVLQAALTGRAGDCWGSVLPAYLNHDVAGTWSQPTVSAALETLADQDVERVWVFPCDFPVEGGEILGGLSQALNNGPISDIRLIPCLNDDAAFIDYLAERVQRALREPQGQLHCDACPQIARE